MQPDAMYKEGPIMSSINALGLPPLTNRHHVQASDLAQAIAQSLDGIDATDTAASPTSQASAGTTPPTGFKAVPRLSADVVSALISQQSQEAAGGASSTSLAGAPPASNAGGSIGAAPSDPSKPQTLQQIAGQYDIHHLTDQQEGQLEGKLVTSGALSQETGVRLFATTVFSDSFNAQHYRIINGQLVATTPSPPGRLIGAGGPAGGPQYDIVQRVQQSLAADRYFGDSQNAATDQKILDVLNKIDAIRNGGTAQ